MPIRAILSVLVVFIAIQSARASQEPALDPVADAPKAESDAQRTQTLAMAFREAYESGDWRAAIVAATRLAAHDPLDGRSAYNLACVYALDGQLEKAMKWLDIAAREGYADPEHMRQDTDLRELADRPRFRELLATVRSNRADRLNEFTHWWDKRSLRVSQPDGEPATGRPLVIALHGFGSDSADIAERFESVAKDAGAVLASPESGREVTEQGGYMWSDEDEAEWVILRTINRMETEHGIDPNRIVLAGYSQGAFVAMRFALKYPERVAGVVSVAGFYDPALTPFNRFKADEPLPRFALMIGSEDNNIGSMREAEKALRAHGGTVSLRVYEGLGHAFPEESGKELAEAIAFVMEMEKEPASPTDD